MKKPRFKVSFAYVLPTNMEVLFGRLEEKLLTCDELEFMLRVLAPMQSNDYIANIHRLRRNDFFVITIDEYVETKLMKKYLKIVRN
jgi:hypothetical protein